MKLLLADDERELTKALKAVLEKNKYTVDAVENGEDALEYARAGAYDGIILDVMMPGPDGISVLRALRAGGNSTPVMLLTARSEVSDRVLGLEAGADDYLPKPFAMAEFLARVKALLRRSGSYAADILTLGDLSLNAGNYELSAPGGSLRLNNKEYQLMELFMRNPEKIFSTEDLMEKLWGWDSEAEINVVWTNIANLRRKLEKLSAGVSLRSIRGVGYELEEKKC